MKYITSKILASPPLLLFPSLSLIGKISPGSYFFLEMIATIKANMNHPFFFFLPVIIYIYIFESVYYSLKCLKVHVCNYCRSAHFTVAPFLHRYHGYHSYLEVQGRSVQVRGAHALNDNVHVALEKGSYELDSTGSRTFDSCSFLF